MELLENTFSTLKKKYDIYQVSRKYENVKIKSIDLSNKKLVF